MDHLCLKEYSTVEKLPFDENFRRLKKKKGCELVLLELPKDVSFNQILDFPWTFPDFVLT